MLQMETDKSPPPSPKGSHSPTQQHDTKRFRLRAVSHVTEIYQRFYHPHISGKVCKAQIIFAGLIICSQMIISTLLQLKEWRFIEDEENSDNFAVARIFSWLSFAVTGTAASLGLWACRKPSYAKLHATMALNIIGTFVYLILLCSLSLGQTQGLSKKLDSLGYEEVRGIQEETTPLYDPKQYSFEEHIIGNFTTFFFNETATERLETPNNILLGHGHAKMHKKIFTAAFLLSSFATSCTCAQIIFSIFMGWQTARAICCGRSHLEGKFLEVEAVEKGIADSIINFRVGSKSPQQHIRRPSQTPPPYQDSI